MCIYNLNLKVVETIQAKVGESFIFFSNLFIMCLDTFVYYSEEDVSQCAVPISSAIIKQIVNKPGTGKSENLSKILEHFYGPRCSDWPTWPYTYKNPDR